MAWLGIIFTQPEVSSRFSDSSDNMFGATIHGHLLVGRLLITKHSN